jgi:putative flippase GtrA
MKLAAFSPTRSNLIQFLEYLIGGSSYFWTGYITFAICYSGFGWHWLPSKLLADVVGWTANYMVQRYWAFAAPNLRGQDSSIIGRYGALTLANLGLDYLIIWGLVSIGITPYVGFFISAGFFTVWNYLWYRFWVFYVKKSVAP